MSATGDLKQIMGMAYRAQVLKQGNPAEAKRAFIAASSNPDFVTAARLELSALSNVDSKRCFASSEGAKFLGQALASIEQPSE